MITKPPSIFCAGHAQENTAKAEDVWDVTIGKQMSIAAVFDGHGGKTAAQRCKKELMPILLKTGLGDSSAIVDAFWDLDQRVGGSGTNDGTTATVLLVWPQKVGNAMEKLQCLLAWVGDSTAFRVNMTAETATGAHVPGSTTATHSLSNTSEVRWLRLEWSVRAQIELARERAAEGDSLTRCSPAVEATPAFDTLRSSGSTTPDRLSHGSDMSAIVAHIAPDREEVQRAVHAAGHSELSEDDLALLVRALAREKRMELPQHLHEAGCSSGELRKKLCRGMSKLAITRSPAATTATARTSYIGEPRAVQRLYSPAVAGGGKLVSVAMTRSIGDWDASRAMVALRVEKKTAHGRRGHMIPWPFFCWLTRGRACLQNGWPSGSAAPAIVPRCTYECHI